MYFEMWLIRLMTLFFSLSTAALGFSTSFRPSSSRVLLYAFRDDLLGAPGPHSAHSGARQPGEPARRGLRAHGQESVPADEREEDESYIEKAGPGATGKYSKWAPNTADYDDDINFRKALMDNVLSDRNRRKEKNGGRVGAQVADDYMAALSKKPQKEKDD